MTDDSTTPAGDSTAGTTCPSCHSPLEPNAARCSQCGAWFHAPDKLVEPRPDDVLAGRYRLKSLLGVGGMARVWRARDLAEDREVAIKVLGIEQVGDAEAEARFLNEGRTAQDIRHPNVVQVFDHGLFPNGMPYIAMELLEGKLLSDLIRQVGTLSPERTLRIMRQVAGGVAEAHKHGLLHRDLKPDNIIVEPPAGHDKPERAVLLDFGISIHAETGEAKESKDQLGTAAYAAPEQATGDPVGTRADVFSLGVVMYQLLTGVLPGKRAGGEVQSGEKKTARVVYGEDGGYSSPALRMAIDKIVVQALSPDPKQRHVDARHLLRELERAAVFLPNRDADVPLWKKLLSEWWWLPVLLAVVAGITAWVWFTGRSG